MAIALDANLGATDGGAGGTAYTLTTTAAAASGTLIVVLVSYFNTGNVTSVTVGGSGATLDKNQVSGNDRFAIYSFQSSGGLASSSSIVVNFAATGGGVLIGAASFTGVVSSGALVTTAGSTGSGTSWSSGAGTNTGFADALYIGGCGNEDPTAGTSSTATAGTEIHDRYRAVDGQGIATGFQVVSTVASRAITGNWSNANSTANTGALAVYAAAAGGAVTVKKLAALGVG